LKNIWSLPKFFRALFEKIGCQLWQLKMAIEFSLITYVGDQICQAMLEEIQVVTNFVFNQWINVHS
jgi:hypothetical protein